MKKTIEERARYYQVNIEVRNPNAEAWDFEIAYRHGAEDQREIDIEKACDAYCKVCGHFSHTVPTHICRQDCRYYTDFKQAIEGES